MIPNRRQSMAILAILFAAAASPVRSAGAPVCGGDVPCTVEEGEYRIVLPATAPLKGALVFFHGHRSSAAAQMGDKALMDAALSRGFAFVAPDGQDGTWAHAGAPRVGRDEIAFVRAVFTDLGVRFGIGPERTIVGGFSQGASMAWYTACASGDRVAGAVTFSGVFWSPIPKAEDCPATPPPMIHIHGRTDRVFPLEGRTIGSRWRQGDTFESLAVVRERAGCVREPEQPVEIGGIACREAEGCARGPITACIHDGGHRADAAWLGGSLDRLMP